MFTSKSALMACGAALLGLVVAAAGDAASMTLRRTNHLTFSGPVGLPGVTLPRGTYTFALIDDEHPDIVRVMSRDRSQVYFTGYTRRVRRPAGLSADRAVAFAETPSGVAPRIQAWYPIGVSTGHEFRYPDATR
ncbi:MAG TPA: hypothetical protein VIX63_16845 [Vicinamibacterales bacterium]